MKEINDKPFLKRLGEGESLGSCKTHTPTKGIGRVFSSSGKNAATLGHSSRVTQHRQLLPRRQLVQQKHSGKDPSCMRQLM